MCFKDIHFLLPGHRCQSMWGTQTQPARHLLQESGLGHGWQGVAGMETPYFFGRKIIWKSCRNRSQSKVSRCLRAAPTHPGSIKDLHRPRQQPQDHPQRGGLKLKLVGIHSRFWYSAGVESKWRGKKCWGLGTGSPSCQNMPVAAFWDPVSCFSFDPDSQKQKHPVQDRYGMVQDGTGQHAHSTRNMNQAAAPIPGCSSTQGWQSSTGSGQVAGQWPARAETRLRRGIAADRAAGKIGLEFDWSWNHDWSIPKLTKLLVSSTGAPKVVLFW